MFHSSFRYSEAYAMAMICDRILEKYILYDDAHSDFRSDQFITQIEAFTRYEWIQHQSFCWKNQAKIQFLQLMSYSGTCFTFNGNPKVLNHSKYIESYPKLEKLNLKITFSVCLKISMKTNFLTSIAKIHNLKAQLEVTQSSLPTFWIMSHAKVLSVTFKFTTATQF